MNYSFFDVLTLIGSIVLFLYGMKLMSEALQKVAGSKMRNVLSAMTSNRFKGVLTGLLITTIIQSSSATTVMVVSFVNAGLLSLIEAVGVIMGANIGTTITAWLISILGFKVKMNILALPLIGLGFPLVFSRNKKLKSWGEVVVGFAILFIGLGFLKDAVPDIKQNPQILEFLSAYTGNGFWSVLFFLFIGTLLTVIVQSSSATMALTLVMCYNGWIQFDMAAAMVLGENIGTTITANIAAYVANSAAKRAAIAHLLFNLIGVTWLLILFPFFLKGIDMFLINSGGESAFQSPLAIPIALSVFHSTFNVANTLLLVGFAPLIAKLSERLIKNDENEDEYRLMYINTGNFSTAEIEIVQAKKEIVVYAERASKMFRLIPLLLEEKKSKEYNKKLDKIEKYEEILDSMEVEIAEYLTRISSDEISKESSYRVRTMLKVIDEIESIGDTCELMAINISSKRDEKATFSTLMNSELKKAFELVNNSLKIMLENLSGDYHDLKLEEAKEVEKELNDLRDRLREQHLLKIGKGDYKNYKSGMYYSNLFSLCERLGDFVINVTESLNEYNKSV